MKQMLHAWHPSDNLKSSGTGRQIVLNKEHSWIVLSYKVPSEPSTIRVRVWRTLKALGVVYIQQSVCVAPDTAEVQKKIQSLKKLIESNKGEENEAELGKLKRWYKKIAKRDFFSCANSMQAKQKLEECEQTFRVFMEAVYTAEGGAEGEITKANGGFHERSQGAGETEE